MRFVAIMAVIAFHLAGEVISKSGTTLVRQDWYRVVFRAVSNGNRGVQLFFALSGFILGRPFAASRLRGEKKVVLKKYYLRRLTRLEPPYIINLLTFMFAGVLYLHVSVIPLLPHLAASILYLHQIIYRAPSTINGVAWTLEIEVQFYACAPLLALLYRIHMTYLRRLIFLILIITFSFLQMWLFFKAYWYQPIGIVYSTLIFYIPYFLVGMFLADLEVTTVKSRPALSWDLLSLCSFLMFFLLNSFWDGVLLPMCALIALVGAYKGSYTSRFLRCNVIAVTGGMCYSIYLWHFFFIALFHKITGKLALGHDFLLNFIIQGSLLLPLVLMSSALLYVSCERPFMNPIWPKLFVQRLGLDKQ